jgi:hypothetical protein
VDKSWDALQSGQGCSKVDRAACLGSSNTSRISSKMELIHLNILQNGINSFFCFQLWLQKQNEQDHKKHNQEQVQRTRNKSLLQTRSQFVQHILPSFDGCRFSKHANLQRSLLSLVKVNILIEAQKSNQAILSRTAFFLKSKIKHEKTHTDTPSPIPTERFVASTGPLLAQPMFQCTATTACCCTRPSWLFQHRLFLAFPSNSTVATA